jgi:hypothetical protein
MRDRILAILSSEPKKAADIRKIIGEGVTKSDVNKVLYTLEKDKLAKRDDEFQWTKVGESPESTDEPADTELEAELEEEQGVDSVLETVDQSWGEDGSGPVKAYLDDEINFE